MAGVAVELGRSLPDMPWAIVDESRRRGLPLVALRQVVPFIQITEAVNTAIVTQTLTEQPHRSGAEALLADLEGGTALSQHEVTVRLRALGFRPERTHRLIGVAAHAAGPATAAALLERAAALLGAPLLHSGSAGGALLAVPGAPADDPVRTARAAVAGAAAAGSDADGLTFALGPAVRADAGWRRWGRRCARPAPRCSWR